MSRSQFVGAASALVMTLGLAFVSSSVASASAFPESRIAGPADQIGKSCGEGWLPPDPVSGSIGAETSWHGIDIQLHFGVVNGVGAGWAVALNGPGQTRVWLDYSADGGSSWYRCGPQQWGDVGAIHTRATRTYPSNSYVMRACADAPGAHEDQRCTDWA